MTDLVKNENLQQKERLWAVNLALVPLLVVAAFYYGPRVLIMAVISVFTCLITDILCRMDGKAFSRKRYDWSTVTIGLLLIMFLPASAPYWLVSAGGIFAVIAVRFPFGGHYNTLFHPAATAFAFLLLCWNELCTRYPVAMEWLSLDSKLQVPLYTSPAYRLMLGGAEKIDWLDAMLGNFSGPLGCTCILVILCCGLFLAVKKVILWQIPVTAVFVVSFFAYFTPRTSASYPWNSVKLELISGCFLFTLIFLAAVDSGEISTNLGKITYGVLFGLLTVLFRYLSRVEMVSPFVLIIMNTIDNKCDSYGAWILSSAAAAGRAVLRLISAFFLGAGKCLLFLWNKFFELLQNFVDPSEEGKGGKDNK